MKVIALYGVFLCVSVGLWSGCLGRKAHPGVQVSVPVPAMAARFHVESGTQIRVALRSRLSARTPRPGDTWEGRMAEDAVVFRAGAGSSGSGAKLRKGPDANAVVVLEQFVIPAGSRVTGVVTAVSGDTSGPWAMSALAVKAINVKGRAVAINASAGRIVAGAPWPRGPGAPADSAGAVVLRFTVNEIVDLQ